MVKRFLALVLCFAMVLSVTPHIAKAASTDVSIYHDGVQVQSVTLPQNEKTELAAFCSKNDISAYQWQILAYEDVWVDIANEAGNSIILSYAMVANLLQGGVASVRCKVSGSDAVYYSEPVSIAVDYSSYLVGEAGASSRASETAAVSETVVASENETSGGDASDSSAEISETSGGGASGGDAQGSGTNTFYAWRMARSVQPTYNVVINYVFADGSMAADSWTATVVEGSSVGQTVVSPTVIGYTPDQSEIVLDYEITQDVTITVTYQPAQVKFTVVHYQQNLNDDNYTEVEPRDEKTGCTEDPVVKEDGETLANSYEGFYALLYDTSTEIAADGSTVVEIYYDRYYYLMNFDLDGGYGVEPIYARYGAPISIGTPEKPGYTFDGWDAAIPATMPAENKTFTASWIAGTTTYDVVFWYENADDDVYSQAGVLYDIEATAGSIVSGSTYANADFTGRDSEHFTYSHADMNVGIKGDGSTVVNVYFSRNIYTMTFVIDNDEDDCTVATHTHSDSCYEFTCTKEIHSHGESCNATLNCNIPVHTSHTAACCTVEEHDHEESGCSWLIVWLCGKSEHTHGDGNCSCAQQIHSHGTGCYVYSCGKEAHNHSAVGGSCYSLNCGLNEHYHDGNTCYLVVKAKYDADITSVWEADPVKSVIDGGDAFESSLTGYKYSFLEKMTGQDITLTQYNYSGSKYTWYYYLEVLPGQDTTDLTVRTDGGKTYYLYHTSSVNGNNVYLTYNEDYFPITGFTQRDSSVPSFSNRTAYLYYTRNSYDLSFINYGTEVVGHGGAYLYQADISGTNFTPAYPSTLEPDAYVFEGWYTSPFYGDTKFEFTTTDDDGNTVKATMPANNLTLYARWVPKIHNVNVYLTSEMNEKDKLCDTQVIAHGNLAVEPEEPENGLYTFVGWFYMDGDTEKAFDFSMPVKKDMDIYAKWSSKVLMEYTIRYAVEDENGNLTYIADDTTGSALAGTTKTFTAKSGSELYKDYQVGYYPETNSHSLTIDIEDADKNIFTFIYIAKEEVPYIVKYLEFETGAVLKEQKNATTRAAVITETFAVVEDYMPDAYQKRLVLSADETQNVIIFWYVKDEIHAPVQIIHYIQNAEGEEYQEYQSSADLNGVIDKTYSTNVLNITGYTYDHATANNVAVEAVNGQVSGTVGKAGLVLKLYYNRNLYPYEFKFLEQGTNEVLADSVTGEARYGAQVTQNAKEIPGYTCQSNALSMIIQIEDGETAEKNVRIFYYIEDEVTINYVAVGPVNETNFGWVSPAEESVKIFSGTANGSVPVAAEGYRFVGWYYDEACMQVVTDTAWLDGDQIKPQKTANYGTDTEKKVGYTTATYYAKFEPALTDLIITKTVADGSTVSEDQPFIFAVTGNNGFSITVVIEGTGSVTIADIPIDSYTVEEKTNWSWQYSPNEVKKTITLQADAAANVVTFKNTSNPSNWLTSTDYNKNVFKATEDNN